MCETLLLSLLSLLLFVVGGKGYLCLPTFKIAQIIKRNKDIILPVNAAMKMRKWDSDDCCFIIFMPMKFKHK